MGWKRERDGEFERESFFLFSKTIKTLLSHSKLLPSSFSDSTLLDWVFSFAFVVDKEILVVGGIGAVGKVIRVLQY